METCWRQRGVALKRIDASGGRSMFYCQNKEMHENVWINNQKKILRENRRNKEKSNGVVSA